MATKITNSISEYIQGNLERKNARWLFKNGELMFELQPDVWASEESLMSSIPSMITLSLMTKEAILIKQK